MQPDPLGPDSIEITLKANSGIGKPALRADDPRRPVVNHGNAPPCFNIHGALNRGSGFQPALALFQRQGVIGGWNTQGVGSRWKPLEGRWKGVGRLYFEYSRRAVLMVLWAADQSLAPV